MSEARKILLAIPDLFFSVRIAEAARALGFTPEDVGLPDLPRRAEGAVLVVLDLGQPGDWQAALRALKADATSANVPVLAFGSHVDVAASRAAVKAGADRLVTRGKLVAELPSLLTATASERRTTADE